MTAYMYSQVKRDPERFTENNHLLGYWNKSEKNRFWEDELTVKNISIEYSLLFWSCCPRGTQSCGFWCLPQSGRATLANCMTEISRPAISSEKLEVVVLVAKGLQRKYASRYRPLIFNFIQLQFLEEIVLLNLLQLFVWNF